MMNMQIPNLIENFIGGNFVTPQKGNYLNNTNPATGEVYSQIPNSTLEDVDLAVAAAEKAFPTWSKTSAEERFRVMNRIAELIKENLDFLALAESNDNGKPLSLSKRVDIPRAAENFRFFASSLMHFAT